MKLSMSTPLAAFTVAAGVLLGTAAQAALPTGTLSYLQQTGAAAGDETIDVWVRLTLDTNSVPLDFSSDPLTGIDEADLPAQGQYYDFNTQQFVTADFVEYTGAFLNTYFTCTGNFNTGCIDPPPYSFQFHTSSAPGAPSINFLDSFSLQPGQSTDYLFGRFVPQAGGAPSGSYIWHNTGLTLSIRGFDANGNSLTTAFGFHDIAQSCPSIQDSCAFTRDVTAVPEPGTYGLMALGLLGVGALVRRKKLH